MHRFNPHTVTILAFVISVALSFTFFGNGISGDFVFDDKIVIVGHPLITEEFPDVMAIFKDSYHSSQPRTGLYRPLTIASYAFNSYIFGTSPASFHVINIFLHAIVTFLLFIVVRQRVSVAVASIAAILFLVLPIHVEDVMSIVGRAELFSLLFVLAGLWAVYCRRWWLGAIFLFFGLLSKESAIALIPIVMFEELLFRRQAIKATILRMLIFFPALAVYALMRYSSLGEYVLSNDATAIYNPMKFVGFFPSLWTSGKVFFLYLQKTLVPTWFSIDYSFDMIPILNNPFHDLVAIAGLLIGLGLVALAVWKRSMPVGWAAFAFIATYGVIANIVFKTGTIMAERLMYAPSFGLVILVALGIEYIRKKFGHEKILYGLVGLILIFYGYKTIDRNRDWLTEERLFERAYAVAPESVVNRTNRSYLLYIKKDYTTAREEALQVLAIAPDHVPALNLAAQTSKKLGDNKSAEAYWKKTIQLRDDYLRGYLGLGVLYYENGFFVPAEETLSKAISIYPRWTEILYLSLVKTGLKKYDEAIEVVISRFGENPDEPELKFAIGVALYKKGDRDRANGYVMAIKSPSVSKEAFIQTIEKNTIFRVIDL